ncbi:hypothetical protein DFA_08289 [Cavenderia fasciculata]|uniref:Lipid-binding serum glycoprotein C-terminal domain-containing protein n=1 Tax=Cavenderia fasciculata TaxID=261658 RepID=F4Q5N7_CACFS|nr:uncharacterized protein DFA_08289 [Cavenderia fasciculata]EGG17296.1 hypothetical protein DFA_08289 [Cavenderia fasciculata]|eukprot:XP_004355780.1 hypothetical protein DFA_08289 [Cavenderia fasciculata]
MELFIFPWELSTYSLPCSNDISESLGFTNIKVDHLCFLLVVAVLVSQTVLGQIPYNPSGIYIGLSDLLIRDVGSQITTEVQNTFNSYAIPSQSGSSSSADYTFSNFQQSLALDEFFLIQGTTDTAFELGWQNIGFNVKWNYHICAKTIFNPCEDGWIQVYTNSNSSDPIVLGTSFTFDYTTQQVSFQAINTTMLFNQGTISIFVQCTNSICVIPVDDIASMVANEFIPTVTEGVTNELNSYASKIEAMWVDPQYKLDFSVNGNDFYLDLTGSIIESSNRSVMTPTMTIQFAGTSQVSTSSGTVNTYPVQPTDVPDRSLLENFDTDMAFTLTPYIFESLAYLPFESIFPITLSPSEVPSSSPVQLNTSDSFFSQVAPGLSAYPNLGLQVTLTAGSSLPSASINSSGVTLSNIQFIGQFDILASSGPIDAFTVEFIVAIDLKSNATVGDIPNQILLATTLVGLSPAALVTNTNIGTVDETGFVQLLQMLQGVIVIPTFTVTAPPAMEFYMLNVYYDTDVLQIQADLNWKAASLEHKATKTKKVLDDCVVIASLVVNRVSRRPSPFCPNFQSINPRQQIKYNNKHFDQQTQQNQLTQSSTHITVVTVVLVLVYE